MTTQLRFSVIRIKHGPWLVTDQFRNGKAVATCAEPHAAEALAALMNGDADAALANRDAALAALEEAERSKAA